jgi:hypothetical protein
MESYPQLRRYPGLTKLLPPMTFASSATDFNNRVVPYLIDCWLDDYLKSVQTSDIVETRNGAFSYLFDISSGRLISAWGISQGRHAVPREVQRMRGFPLSAGPNYHRGHAIPHTLGGPTDINLVPQLGKVNVGPFRPLEKRAVATPGSLYFTYWTYAAARPAGGAPGQTPAGVDQGLLIPGRMPVIVHHGN